MSVRNHKKGSENEADYIHVGGDRSAFRVRDDACDPHLPRRNDDPGGNAVSAASASAPSAADDGHLPGWNDGHRWNGLPGAAATAASTAATAG